MKLFAEFMVDQALLCGAPWRKMTEIYFEEYTKSPKKTFIKIVFIFIFFWMLYFLTLGVVNIKTLIYPHYKNYQRYLMLVAKNRDGVFTKADVQEMCQEDSLDYIFIEYMLV